MTSDAEAFKLQDQIRQIGASDDRADTVAQADTATNNLATEARSLLKDSEFMASLSRPDSPVPGLSVLKDDYGNPTALEIYANGTAMDFYGDGSSVSNGLTVKRDENGNPISYEKNGNSVALHADRNEWYYHPDRSNSWDKVDPPSVAITGTFISQRPSVDMRIGRVDVDPNGSGAFQLGDSSK